jgi:hypothetical protein
MNGFAILRVAGGVFSYSRENRETTERLRLCLRRSFFSCAGKFL